MKKKAPLFPERLSLFFYYNGTAGLMSFQPAPKQHVYKESCYYNAQADY
jgi:hypothetical protein